ncbi:MAG: RidA family protein [Cyanobacteria bacterium P01_H01_bin.121]
MFERITLPASKLPPAGPYSHAVRAGDFLFVTGQLAEDSDLGGINTGPIETQFHQVMRNLQTVLTHAGASLDQAAMVRIFVTDIRHLPIVNELYPTYFPQGLPGRTSIGVTGLAGMGDIEIDLIVYCGG